MTNNFLIDNFKHLTTTPENVEQLKKLVLQLAVQGKLTEKWRKENPDVEPASVLLEKIKAEKEQLIKEGKIKKQKPLSPIADEDKPFDLPESWEWARMGDITDMIYGSSLTKAQCIPNGKYPVYGSNGIVGFYNEFLTKKRSIIIGRKGSSGALNISEKPSWTTDVAYYIEESSNIDFTFLFYLLKSLSLENLGKGIKPGLNRNEYYELLATLPPLEEQKAIVSQIEKLFTQIDQLHTLAQKRINYREKSAKALFNKINHAENDTELQETWQTLTAHFHTLTQSKESVKQLRQSILQLAVQGKLSAKWREHVKTQNLASPDDPNYNASALLEKIKTEKEQLIKDKVVKKGKKQPPAVKINLKNPKLWLLVDLDDISQFITDGTHQTPRYVEKGKMFLSAQNIKPFKFMPEQHKYVSEEAYLEYIKNRKVEKGDILVGRVGSKGEAAVVDRELDFAIYVSLGLVKTFQKYTSPEYLVIVMNSPYGNSYATGNMSSLGASAGNFNLGRIRSFPIPLPPLEEQKVIVSKVKQLMSWCDELEKKIEKRDTYQHKMMQAVVKQAFKTEG